VVRPDGTAGGDRAKAQSRVRRDQVGRAANVRDHSRRRCPAGRECLRMSCRPVGPLSLLPATNWPRVS